MLDEWKYITVDLSDDSTTVNNKPTLVKGVYVNTVLSNHTVNLEDDTTPVVTLVAQLAAGTLLEFPPTMFETSLVVDPDDSATGNITVFYQDLR